MTLAVAVCPACHRTLICGEVLGAIAGFSQNAWMMVAANLIPSALGGADRAAVACHIGSFRLIQLFREM